MIPAPTFEAQRPRLVGLAYRMLGQVQRAEELVQEAWLRAQDVAVEQPAPWLTRVVTRLCVDELRSAARRREVYPGPWLPEPWIHDEPDVTFDRTLHLAFLHVLERLTPPQRAAFLLRDVFDEDYDDIADTLHVERATARQHAARARQAVTADTPRFDPDPEGHARLLAAFGHALQTGDREALHQILHADCVALSDGGGVVHAAKIPIVGRERVARAYLGLGRKLPDRIVVHGIAVNGLPAALVVLDGAPQSVLAVGMRGGVLTHLWSLVNPDKLRHVPEHYLVG